MQDGDRSAPAYDFLAAPGGGETAALMRAHDWAATPLGPIARWPQSLKTASELLIRSPVPIALLWGPDGVMIYNDAYAVIAGGKHPSLLGSSVREAWPEIAAFNDRVMQVGLGGGTLSFRDQELTLLRHGVPEQVWFDLDYSPVICESGKPGGVIAIVVETTARVLSQRRADADHARLSSMFQQAPGFMAMLEGPDHRIALANPAYLKLIGRSNVLGRSVAEALPDAAAQGYVALLDEVFASGRAYSSTSALYAVQTETAGPVNERYVDFVYQPVSDADGTTTGVFVQGYDVTERIAAVAELRKREHELQTMADNLPVLVSYVDRTGRYRFVNCTYEDWFGFRREDIVGRHVREIVGDEAYRLVEPFMDRAFAGEKISFERFIPYPNAAPRHVHVEYVPRRDDAGEVDGYYAMIQDISELRRHESHQRLLINELNHRVKNTLATVQSMAMQTLRSTLDPNEARARLEGRLLALSKAHDVLTRENWECAWLMAVVVQAVAPFGGSSERFEIDGPELQITPKYALALSMALHELGTNAVKYGALSTDGGRIGIACAIAGDAASRELRLRWSETGGPEVQPRTHRGFGSRLLESGLKHDLGGMVELSFAPAGLVCTICAPLNDTGGQSGVQDQGSTSLRT